MKETNVTKVRRVHNDVKGAVNLSNSLIVIEQFDREMPTRNSQTTSLIEDPN